MLLAPLLCDSSAFVSQGYTWLFPYDAAHCTYIHGYNGTTQLFSRAAQYSSDEGVICHCTVPIHLRCIVDLQVWTC
jgi:hypothetical protein